MDESSGFYENNLYPLQDGILAGLGKARSPFYLTGGTAIGRAWFGHRYSDDLDLFVNRDPAFPAYVAEAIRLLGSMAGEGTFEILRDRSVAAEKYVQINVRRGSVTLKLDFVNDIAPHFGSFDSCPLYPKVDGLRNILSNKLTALYRYEPKDVADIWVIAKHCGFSWPEILAEAREKELGLDAPDAAQVLGGFPSGLFEAVRWKNPPDRERFFAELSQIAMDLLRGEGNTLAPSEAMQL